MSFDLKNSLKALCEVARKTQVTLANPWQEIGCPLGGLNYERSYEQTRVSAERKNN
jgi:hypothetical protein